MKYYRFFPFIVFLFTLFISRPIFPLELTLGISSGIGSLSNPELRMEYGNSMVYNPYLGAEIFDGLTINIGYEGGFKKEITLVYHSELEITGYQLFAEYTFNKGSTFAFVKGGIGLYTVNRSFFADELKEYDFTEKSPGFLFGFGIKFLIRNKFLVKVEVMDLIVQMRPFYGWVNAGGVRYLAGLVMRFDI